MYGPVSIQNMLRLHLTLQLEKRLPFPVNLGVAIHNSKVGQSVSMPKKRYGLLSKKPFTAFYLKRIFRDPLIRSTFFSTHTDFIVYSERTLLY